MMRLRLALCLLCLWLPNTSVARNLIDAWIVHPIPGQRGALKQALLEHMAYRESQEEEYTWLIYTPMLGDNVSAVLFYRCCVTWDEMERLERWRVTSGVDQHWLDFVEPFVQRMERYISDVDLENSNWPIEPPIAPYMAVTEMYLDAEHMETAWDGVKRISDQAKAMDWPFSWQWSRQLGGAPIINYVVPYSTLVELSPTDTDFETMMAEYLGDPAKARQEVHLWLSHFDRFDYQIYKLEPALNPDINIDTTN
ncbi:hypothetical protein [Ferrimonas marina]|uniref:NIPSNAP protein n=1 Tax=Ferrimonas marina TaxID=299255 RepID=A0A1M5MR18_9GAMM|nr:hypothetical protein [Ferrimonas marina]SHG79223.1 hypothetical protein SAMN02745129_0725 [Ferrimonas marina]